MIRGIFTFKKLAHAKSSSFSINVKNQSGSAKKLIKGSDLGGNQVLQHSSSKWTRFSTKDTAYYRKTKTYHHDIEVQDLNGNTYCKLTIWLKNKVEFFGNTRIKDYHDESSNPGRGEIRKDTTDDPADLSLILVIK